MPGKSFRTLIWFVQNYAYFCSELSLGLDIYSKIVCFLACELWCTLFCPCSRGQLLQLVINICHQICRLCVWRNCLTFINVKQLRHTHSMGAFHLMAWPVRPEFESLFQLKNLVYVSQISSENGPHSNFIEINFRSARDRSEAQTFCVPFNNLTVLTDLAVFIHGKRPIICVVITCKLSYLHTACG